VEVEKKKEREGIRNSRVKTKKQIAVCPLRVLGRFIAVIRRACAKQASVSKALRTHGSATERFSAAPRHLSQFEKTKLKKEGQCARASGGGGDVVVVVIDISNTKRTATRPSGPRRAPRRRAS